MVKGDRRGCVRLKVSNGKMEMINVYILIDGNICHLGSRHWN